MRMTSLVVVPLLTTTGAALAQAPAPQPLVLDCTEFSKNTDEAALVKRFGRENVVKGRLEGAEDETVPGTVVYPKDPSRVVKQAKSSDRPGRQTD